MDQLMECPFDRQHRIIRHRMPFHIVKCKKNYNGPPLDTCPYNAMHWTPKGNMKAHLLDCPDYQTVMQERYLQESLPSTLSK